MANMRSIRRDLYRAARLLGDLQAVANGPSGILRRIANKAIGRHVVSRLFLGGRR